MNKKEFIIEFEKITNYFNKTIEDKDILNLYYEAVKHKSVEEFRNIVIEIIKNNKFMPRVADFQPKKVGYEQRDYSSFNFDKFYNI